MATNKAQKQKELKYIEHRKKCLKELMKLTYNRGCITREIRALNKELRAWDNVLIQGD